MSSRRKILQTSQVCFDGAWIPPTPSMSMFLAGAKAEPGFLNGVCLGAARQGEC